MAEDTLGKLTPPEVAAFYARLADGVDQRKGTLKVSLAAMLMRLWLKNRDPKAKLQITAPDHLKNHAQVLDSLSYHREVFLTEKRARMGGGEIWAGVIPRLQGRPPHQKWDYRRPINIEYESLTEMPLRYQVTGNDIDRDLLYALHGFQLHSTVTLVGEAAGARVRIRFQSFQTYVRDRYDWDYSEHLTVPNPDFGSQARGAVEPKSQKVVVFHRNAKRIEDAGLAAPYDFVTDAWQINDPRLTAPAEVDPARRL
jgi:hypothetical protein